MPRELREDAVSVGHGDVMVGGIFRTTASDGTTKYVIRGDAEMQLAVMRVTNPQMSKEALAVLAAAEAYQVSFDCPGDYDQDGLTAADRNHEALLAITRAYRAAKGEP
jgi:hypothetical protein